MRLEGLDGLVGPLTLCIRTCVKKGLVERISMPFGALRLELQKSGNSYGCGTSGGEALMKSSNVVPYAGALSIWGYALPLCINLYDAVVATLYGFRLRSPQ